MKILVTGALGAIGSPLVKELRNRGHTVWISDRAHHHDPLYIKADIAEFHQVELLLQRAEVDFVYHLAAEFGRRAGEEFYENLWKTNAVGTKNILRMQERLGFRMIFASSSEVYGDGHEILTEDLPERVPQRLRNDYAISKWVNEMQILNSAQDFGTQTVRIRPSGVYGPGEHYSPYRNAISVFIYRALHNLPYAVYTGHQRTFIYIDDAVYTMANVVERFKPGEVYNVSGTETVDMKTVSDLILEDLGKDDKLVRYQDVEEATVLAKRVDISKAIRDLDHKVTIPLQEGILRTVRWQKEVYNS